MLSITAIAHTATNDFALAKGAGALPHDTQPPESGRRSRLVERRKHRILVIGGPHDSIVVKGALDPQRFEVERLGSFVMLPRVLLESAPDLVLIDINTPAVPGVIMGRYIRERQVRRIPILIYSAAPFPVLYRAVNDMRADGAVPKSSPPNELRDRIERLLRITS